MTTQPPSQAVAYRLLVTFLFGVLTGMASTCAIFLRSPWWFIAVAVSLPGWLWHMRLARKHSASPAQAGER